jgi:haloalkane dehalogenase
MDIDGNRLHYIDEGSGSPIVMLHGNPTWSFYYRHLIDRFSSGYRTIAPDHIGCGLSDKPSLSEYPYTLEQRVADIDAFLSTLNLEEKITLVVHDWGGMIGMAWAVDHPERIERIVILNTAAFFPPAGKRLPLRLRIVRNIPLLSKPAVLGLNLFARSALCMAAKKPIPEEVRRCLVAPYGSWHDRIATYRFVRDIPVRPSDASYQTVFKTADRLRSLGHLPVLICWGRHDFVFDLDYFNEWRLRFPGAEAHLFEEAGHYILEDAPEKVAGLMAAFFDGNNPS